MTISEAVKIVDNLKKGNKISEREKIYWLSELDGIIKSETINTHEGAENVHFSGYDENTDGNTVLLVKEPYCDIYIHYLIAKIDLYMGDSGRYNNDMILYNDAKKRFTDWYNRNHKSNVIKNLRW